MMKRNNIGIDRIGEVGINNKGTKMIIIEYNSSDDIIVEFLDEHRCKVRTCYHWFKKGKVRNPCDITVYGVGYLGNGYEEYTRNIPDIYKRWKQMIRRCYDPQHILDFPSYKDCSVCDEFLCFVTFAEWYIENYYEIPGEKMCLDKDILVKGNKTYSPDKCIFVPEIINNMVVSCNVRRGDLPIGVHYNTNRKTFIAKCSIVDENKIRRDIHLGCFDSYIDAFEQYKQYKEAYIKIIAERYKNQIPDKLYKALYAYKIEIND